MLPNEKYKLQTPIKGIDVSSWQGHIDWAKVKAAGVKFAILRAGYGRYSSQKDARFEEYYAGCKANGIPVGVYWASYAVTAEDAVKEAQACLECIKGKSFEYPIAYDYEAFEGTATYTDPSTGKKLSKQLLPDVAKAVIPAFMNELQKAGYYVSLYSYYAMLTYNIPRELSNAYDVFLAHYATSTNWTNKTVWQNSCKGRINGINGDVDLDTCYYDYPKIIADSKYDNATEPDEKPAPQKKYPIDIENAVYNIREYPYDSNIQLSPHFNVREFRCKCGKPHPTKINDLLVANLEKIRSAIPGCTGINISSGFRCVEHDINVGGSGRGQHTVGNAVDYVAYDGNRNVVSTKKLCCMAQDVGMTGIANINKTYTYLHNDVRPNGVWHGNEIYGNNYCTNPFDFYEYFGLTKEDVYGKQPPVTPPTPDPTPDPEPVTPDPTPEPTPTPGAVLTAGTEVKLDNTTLYGSSTAKTGSKRSGIYYIYSDEIVNGRIRITTPKSNVGKTPIGSHVTGWVNTADIQGTTDSTPATPEPVTPAEPEPAVEPEKPVEPAKPTLTAGTEVNLKSTPLYASAGAKRVSSKKTGKYYIYSDEVINGRIRITTPKSNVGKTPVGNYVTGWANVSDLV